MPATTHESYPCACGLVLKQVTNDTIASRLASKYYYNNMLNLTTKMMCSAMAAHILMAIFRVNSTKCLPNALHGDHQEDFEAQLSDVYDLQKWFLGTKHFVCSTI